MPEVASSPIFLPLFTGLALSVAVEQIMTPRPSLLRAWPAWSLHIGCWLVAHSLLTAILARPWFAAATVTALLMMLVLVNNAKFKALCEPFVFQDYDYFIDAIRHPRLYIPFLGWFNFLLSASGFVLAVTIGILGEASIYPNLFWSASAGGILAELSIGIFLLTAGHMAKLCVRFEPMEDLQRVGLIACLLRYAEEGMNPPSVASPFEFIAAKTDASNLPHLVAVQSESFFDPRKLFSGIRTEILSEFDRLQESAIACGKLRVPAWGANTVRTEFSFLSGINDLQLGVHRFNPYRSLATRVNIPSIASWLKSLGYRTICVHPYPASFYKRDQVYPLLGFDEFLDIRIFNNDDRVGPYVGDIAVADKVSRLLADASGPLFVFVITMENHGPLHLEKITPSEIDNFYSIPPPAGCDDLSIYLRHLSNADRMMTRLRKSAEQCRREVSLCWFGDHVPIMPTVYKNLGMPTGEVEYFYWSNRGRACPRLVDLPVHRLATSWLADMGIFGANTNSEQSICTSQRELRTFQAQGYAGRGD